MVGQWSTRAEEEHLSSHQNFLQRGTHLAILLEQAFTNSLPSTLLAANVHAGRESDPSYSPFSATQAMPSKYGNSVSSIGGSTISMPEVILS